MAIRYTSVKTLIDSYIIMGLSHNRIGLYRKADQAHKSSLDPLLPAFVSSVHIDPFHLAHLVSPTTGFTDLGQDFFHKTYQVSGQLITPSFFSVPWENDKPLMALVLPAIPDPTAKSSPIFQENIGPYLRTSVAFQISPVHASIPRPFLPFRLYETYFPRLSISFVCLLPRKNFLAYCTVRCSSVAK